MDDGNFTVSVPLHTQLATVESPEVVLKLKHVQRLLIVAVP